MSETPDPSTPAAGSPYYYLTTAVYTPTGDETRVGYQSDGTTPRTVDTLSVCP